MSQHNVFAHSYRYYQTLRRRRRAILFSDTRLRQFAGAVAWSQSKSPSQFAKSRYREDLVRYRLEQLGWSSWWITLAVKLLLPILLDLLISED